MTSKTIKTTLFVLLVLSITVPSTVFAAEENATSTDKVEISNSTDNVTPLLPVIPEKSNLESWENIRGELVSVLPSSVEKLQERGYLVGQLIVD